MDTTTTTVEQPAIPPEDLPWLIDRSDHTEKIYRETVDRYVATLNRLHETQAAYEKLLPHARQLEAALADIIESCGNPTGGYCYIEQRKMREYRALLEDGTE